MKSSLRILVPIAAAFTLAACAPRLAPLSGTVAPVRLPRAELTSGHQRIVFRWDLDDKEFSARGEGAARIAAPDSVRLDFFLNGGVGHGAAVLLGDTLRAPSPDFVRSLVPPPPLLWAALGRMALPALPDTSVRVDGAVLRADIGKPVAWRITFHGDTLSRLERVAGGRIVEWIERSPNGEIKYRHEGARRTLRLTVTHSEPTPPFDASIWHLG